jgi:CRP-like cAMP-binding protein
MRKRQLAPGELAFSAGEVANALYQLVQGEIELSTVSPDGKELILYINYPGDCFGETSLINGSPRFHTASARHASVVLVLPAGQFTRLRGEHPEINHALLRTQSTRLQILATRLGAYASRSLRQVILQRLVFLAENARRQDCGGVLIQTGLSQKEYGKLFGASRQSVNKELNLLQDQKFIELRRNGIFVYSIDDLLEPVPTGA